MDNITQVTVEESTEIISTREPLGLFLVVCEDKYVGIDNTTGDAWTEDFDGLDKCLAWLKGEREDE